MVTQSLIRPLTDTYCRRITPRASPLVHHPLDPLAASVTAVVALAVSVLVSAAAAAVAAVLLLSERISGASPVIFLR